MEPASTHLMADAAVARARAEHAEWSAMLAFVDAELARIDALDASPLRRTVERSAIALEVAQAMGWSEGQAVQRLAVARRVRLHAPATWLAFGAGRLDAARVREISGAVERLERPESVEHLDDVVVAYASTHTVAELRAWLRRFVSRVEADLAAERAEVARRRRSVDVAHDDDAMAWVNAYLPSHQAAAIDERLRRAAQPTGPDDDRTRDERRADAFVDLLLAPESATGPRGGIPTDLAVVVDAAVLAGADTGPVTASDGSWTVPADWVLPHLDADQTVFHRLLVDPVSRDVLAVAHVGRFAPAQLATAIAFRDGVCRAPGCLRSARHCDVDHREPWPAPTAGSNLWSLCRRHHMLKGHGVLRWSLPSGRTAPAEAQRHGLPAPPSSTRERAVVRTVAG